MSVDPGPAPESAVDRDPPALVRRIDLLDMITYAGATWDWHRMHYDADYVQRKGFAAPVVDGQMLGALVADQILRWAGPGWRLTRLAFRFANLVFAGETVRSELRVSERSANVDGGSPPEDRLVLEGRVVVEEDGRPAVSGISAVLTRRSR